MQVQDIQNNIMLKLQEIEKANGVKIILAVESGSRAWKMASRDSDFDVRFIYVRPEKDYLRLDNIKDIIDWQLDEVYDINGWDLKKILQHLFKSNAVVFEWLSSNKIYIESDFAQEIRKVSKDYFQPKNCLYHYWHLADKIFRMIKDEPKVRLKQYLYIIRPLLAAKWIMDKNEIPPIELPTLLGALSDYKVSSLVAGLLQEKVHSTEKDVTLHNEILDEYIDNTLKYIKKSADEMKNEHQSWEALNLLFYNAVRDCYPQTDAIK